MPPCPKGSPGRPHPGQSRSRAYPVYRSAVARGENLSLGSGDMLFFSLFNHISRRGVEMTAPVINTYESTEMVADPDRRGDVSMEFLYRQPDQGEAGPGVGNVQVEDHPKITVVSLGVQGGMSEDVMKSGLARLRTWLVEHADEWVAAGPPRRLGYHGPMTPAPQRLWEIQVPIRAVMPRDNPDSGSPNQ